MWPWGAIAGGHRTVGDTARYIAIHAPATLKAPGEAWSRPQIEAALRRLMHDQLGIEHFEWHHHFVEDLGVD